MVKTKLDYVTSKTIQRNFRRDQHWIQLKNMWNQRFETQKICKISVKFNVLLCYIYAWKRKIKYDQRWTYSKACTIKAKCNTKLCKIKAALNAKISKSKATTRNNVRSTLISTLCHGWYTLNSAKKCNRLTINSTQNNVRSALRNTKWCKINAKFIRKLCKGYANFNA